MQISAWCAPHRPGLVTGLRAEARIARSLGAVAVGGGLSEGAGAAAERLVRAGATALISVGLCGGLHPDLRPGAIVVPRAVITADGRAGCDAALTAALGGVSAASLLAACSVVAEPTRKAELFKATGAVAVDLESGAVARVAERYGLPFAVLRVVCDAADTRLPRAALLALDHTGSIGVWRVAASLLAAPAQVPALLTLARGAAAARTALVGRIDDILHVGALRHPEWAVA
jgi:adenosylhomocysteine nucleosidase